jgi:hypothetical protein
VLPSSRHSFPFLSRRILLDPLSGNGGAPHLTAQSDIRTVRPNAADTCESDDRRMGLLRSQVLRCRESEPGYDHAMRTDELSFDERSTRHVTCSRSQFFRFARRLQRRR